VLVAERSELDLTRQDQTERYLSVTRPDVVTMAAGRVGGILANDTTPREFSRRESCHGAQLRPFSHLGLQSRSVMDSAMLILHSARRYGTDSSRQHV
jgi:hypothetical protein